jgi:transposase-like protein
MSETCSRVEVITGVARRRRFSIAQKLAIVEETMQPGMSISYVARRHGLSPSLVFRWRRLMSDGGREAVRADDDAVPVGIFVYGRAVDDQPAMALVKRSPKRTANWALASAHSRGGILHSFSARFKTRKSSFIAASSVGK